MRHWFALTTIALAFALALPCVDAGEKDNTPPKGFSALFNGKDLTNWQALVMAPDPEAKGKKRNIPAWLAKLPAEEMAKKQKEADDKAFQHWKVVDGVITYDGKNNNLITVKQYGNFEMYVDWKIEANGDSGIYLRGNPQVQKIGRASCRERVE